MAKKSKKKRNKTYQGWDAASPEPTVHRIKAVQRSKFGQWRYENRKPIKIWLIILAVLGVIAFIISGIVGFFI